MAEKKKQLVDVVNIKDPAIGFRGYVTSPRILVSAAEKYDFILTLIGTSNKMLISSRMLEHYTVIKLGEKEQEEAEKAEQGEG